MNGGGGGGGGGGAPEAGAKNGGGGGGGGGAFTVVVVCCVVLTCVLASSVLSRLASMASISVAMSLGTFFLSSVIASSVHLSLVWSDWDLASSSCFSATTSSNFLASMLRKRPALLLLSIEQLASASV